MKKLFLAILITMAPFFLFAQPLVRNVITTNSQAVVTFGGGAQVNTTILAWDVTDQKFVDMLIGANLTYTHATHTLSGAAGGSGVQVASTIAGILSSNAGPTLVTITNLPVMGVAASGGLTTSTSATHVVTITPNAALQALATNNGANLTGLNGTNLVGTITNNTTGNAATATSAINATNFWGLLSTTNLPPGSHFTNAPAGANWIALGFGDGNSGWFDPSTITLTIGTVIVTNAYFAGSNHFAGPIVATNSGNQFVGTFTGDGSALTGLVASAYLPLAGGTESGPVLTTSSSSNSPANLELATAGWVRGLFAGAGITYYVTTNFNASFTNNDVANGTNYEFSLTIPTHNMRFYTNPAVGSYVGSVVITNKILQVQAGITVDSYVESSTGTGSGSLSIHPEIYVSYDKTNWIEIGTAAPQTLTSGVTNLHSWVVTNPSYSTTNASGFYVERRFKVDTQTSNNNADLTVHMGTNFESHITIPGVSSGGGNALLAANQTFTGVNTFTLPTLGPFKAPFSTNYTITAADQIIAFNGTNQVITLENGTNGPVTAGRIVCVIDSGTTGFCTAVVTNANGVQTVLTATALSQTITNGQSLTLIWDGANWR